jgi:hypothetical protein
MTLSRAATLTICVLLSATVFAQQKTPKYGLPAGARVIEVQSLESSGHPDRALALWMVRPKKNPFSGDPDDSYMCPDETRGSCYSGPTRVSLIDATTNRVINTVKVIDVHLHKDTFDVPYAIRRNDYYHVEGEPHRNGERKARVMFLKDHNGDGKALEFALFDAPFCMGLATTLIGYSEARDKVIQYQIGLEVIEGQKRFTDVSRWADYLFAEQPIKPGYWKYEIDYRGRGGSLDKYEIRYDAKTERFQGKLVTQTDQ